MDYNVVGIGNILELRGQGTTVSGGWREKMKFDADDGDCRASSGVGLMSRGILSRRDFLHISCAAITLAGALDAWGSKKDRLIIIEQAKGIIIGDPTKCVGCRRCELACTEFNDGKSSPSTSRIKVTRNLNFGPAGVQDGQRGRGSWGNGLVIQDTCKQCPHPVPCANACPNDAIVMNPQTNARVVDPAKCVGCKMCLGACPWDMMSFDAELNRATKCFLCDGNPKCVSACPAEALTYVSWRDLTRTDKPRVSPTAIMPQEKATLCNDCHSR